MTYTRNVTTVLVERGLEVVIAAPSNMDFEYGNANHIKIDVNFSLHLPPNFSSRIFSLIYCMIETAKLEF